MTELIYIGNRESYEIWSATHEVLIDSRFDVEVNFRKEMQNELFGTEDNIQNRHKLFIWLWERKPHVCEETGAFLGDGMQAIFMSHILTRGAHIEMWNDPRNINILTPDNHRKWEVGKREKMRIWDKNKETTARLKSDYSKLKNYNTFPIYEPVEIAQDMSETFNKISKIKFPIKNSDEDKTILCPHCNKHIFVKIIINK